MKKNLHSHTQFCDGRSSMEDILISAKKAGFDTWGFSPHAPICLDSPCNMKMDSVNDYLKEIDRLRIKFPDINILAGMEVDYIDEDNGPSSPYIQNLNLDFVIGSVHFIPNKQGVYYDIDGSPERFKKYLHDFFEDDLDYVIKSFWLQTQKMIKAGGFDIIGHIDKISLNASSVNKDIEFTPLYSQLINETIDLAILSGKEIEINTKHYKKYHRFFPHSRYWKKIISAGINMPMNSDTHYAELVETGFAEALNILSNLSK